MERELPPEDIRQLSLLDLIYAIVKRRWFVITFTLICAILAVVYALVTPKIWRSKTTLLPIAENTNPLSMNLGLLDMLGGGLLPSEKSDLAIEFITVMESRTFREEVVRKYNLIKYFKLKDPDNDQQVLMEKAVKKLADKIVNISFDQESNLITITIETKDKYMSRDMANYYVDALESYNQSTKLTKGKLKREFLEKRVNEIKEEITSLGNQMKSFQQTSKAIEPDTQTQALIKLYADLISQQIETDMELTIGKNTMSEQSPNLQELKARKDYLNKSIAELEDQKNALAPKYLLQIGNIPDISLKYAQIKMNLEIQQKVFEYIYPQYESARIDELRDLPTLEVIDRANLAGLRARPKRALLVLVITFAAFILSSLIAIISENMSPRQQSLLSNILRELRLKKASI